MSGDSILLLGIGFAFRLANDLAGSLKLENGYPRRWVFLFRIEGFLFLVECFCFLFLENMRYPIYVATGMSCTPLDAKDPIIAELNPPV
jgi:hypothetical protein